MEIIERVATLEANYIDLHNHLKEVRSDVKEIKDAVLNCGELGIKQRLVNVEKGYIKNKNRFRCLLIGMGVLLVTVLPVAGGELISAAKWFISTIL